jgi:hypothetical protein
VNKEHTQDSTQDKETKRHAKPLRKRWTSETKKKKKKSKKKSTGIPSKKKEHQQRDQEQEVEHGVPHLQIGKWETLQYKRGASRFIPLLAERSSFLIAHSKRRCLCNWSLSGGGEACWCCCFFFLFFVSIHLETWRPCFDASSIYCVDVSLLEWLSNARKSAIPKKKHPIFAEVCRTLFVQCLGDPPA